MSTTRPSRLHRAVLLDPARECWRVVDVDQRWVDHRDLTAALGVERAWKCGTPRWETDERVVHLLVPDEGQPLPEDGWSRDPAESGFDHATVDWLTATYDAWRTGRVAVAGRPPRRSGRGGRRLTRRSDRSRMIGRHDLRCGQAGGEERRTT